ncbi:peptidylprolyl isomerase [bacterium]|nr:peptidylprolyl isomerase [bacterium]
MSTPRIAILALLLALFAAPAFAQDAQVVDRVIAVVDDEIILESEVLQYVQDIVLRNRDQYRTETAIAQLKASVLEELINQKILLSIAEDDTNIVVEDRQVDLTLDDRINQVTREIGGEEALVEYYGKPIRQIRRDFRGQVRNSLLIERVRASQTRKTTLTKKEVEDFYARVEEELPTMPERVRLAHILIEVEPADEAQEQALAKADSVFNLIANGANFDSLAMEYSDDRASAPKGGLLGTTQRGDLVPDFEAVAYNLEEGEISEPIRTRFGYHIIRLNWRRGEKINTNHILVMLQATDADEERAVEEARLLRDRIMDGESFADVAKEASADDETAKLGGDLGWFDLSSIPDQFQQVARDLDVGEISEPFLSRVGVHLVTVTAHDEARQLELQRDWDRISQMALREKQEIEYTNWLANQHDGVYIEVMTDEL